MDKAEEFLEQKNIAPGYVLSHYSDIGGENGFKLSELLDEYTQQVSREVEGEILNELINIKEYMEERNAFHGYGQMNALIYKLELNKTGGK